MIEVDTNTLKGISMAVRQAKVMRAFAALPADAVVEGLDTLSMEENRTNKTGLTAGNLRHFPGLSAALKNSGKLSVFPFCGFPESNAIPAFVR
ncbi:MAG: hypothetical protein LBI87_11375 [Candidatus Accumulibacter sp.]|jgi:hypothetical protein|nr:hypothetical protein [Accumulibacter sp.]